MKRTKRILCIVLSVIMLLTILPINSMAIPKMDLGGTCGDNLEWYYKHDTRTLTIYGTGPMCDYDFHQTPWYVRYLYIENIVVKSGVTSIGNHAFDGLSEAAKIDIPDSVQSIGKRAFSFTRISEVKLPDSITEIGTGAFRSCSSLRSVTSLPNSITSIGAGTFWSCNNMNTFVVPDGVTTINNDAFYNCFNLSMLVIPDSVTHIGETALQYLGALKYVHYLGTPEQWETITKSDKIHPDIHYCIEKQGTYTSCDQEYVNDGWYCNDCEVYVKGGESVPAGHILENGYCTKCDYSETPTLNENSQYEISNRAELLWFAEQYNAGNLGSSANAVLTNDIDLENTEFTPIGNSSKKYVGIFDGQGYSINNFKMTINKGGYYGLFGYVDGKDTAGKTVIKNFSINGNVTTAFTSKTDSWYGVVGQADGKTEIINVQSSVNYTAGDTYYKKFVGGIVGQTGDATISKCSFDGTLDLGNSSVDCVGGIAAYSYNGKTVSIKDCAFTGAINSDYTSASQIGGLVGYYNGENGRNMTITNSISVGDITLDGATTKAGAIFGVLNNHTVAQAEAKFTNNYYCSTLNPCGTGNATATFVEKEKVESGEFTYFLQENSTEDIWGQNVDYHPPYDKHPVMYGMEVQKNQIGGCCEVNYIYGYSNYVEDPISYHYFGVYNNVKSCGCGILYGDVNRDELVDHIDYMAMVSHTIKQYYQIEGEEAEFAADLNGDGALDGFDAIALDLHLAQE